MSTLLAGAPLMSDVEANDLDTVTVRIRRDLARMLKTICANTTRGTKTLKVVDYLEELLRDRVEQDHAAVLARLAESERNKRAPKKRGT